MLHTHTNVLSYLRLLRPFSNQRWSQTPHTHTRTHILSIRGVDSIMSPHSPTHSPDPSFFFVYEVFRIVRYFFLNTLSPLSPEDTESLLVYLGRGSGEQVPIFETDMDLDAVEKVGTKVWLTWVDGTLIFRRKESIFIAILGCFWVFDIVFNPVFIFNIY